MTDLQAFIELYQRFNIRCIVWDDERYEDIAYNRHEFVQIVTLSALDYSRTPEYTTDDKLGGYCGFYSHIVFDMNGKFIEQVFYE